VFNSFVTLLGRTRPVGHQTLAAPFDHINVHVRGGHIVPTQQPALTTFASRQVACCVFRA
jgi:alpha-glucosidase (family GH31 glycosyl hydrolase)